LLKRIAKILILGVALVYAVDLLSLRLRIPAREPFGTVLIQRYYAVGLKNKKVEYMQAEPVLQTCTHSLLPEMGYLPCWYVSRHKVKQIDIDSLRIRDDFGLRLELPVVAPGDFLFLGEFLHQADAPGAAGPNSLG
jgi:hypothetical protein